MNSARPHDAEVMFELTAKRSDGLDKRVSSGYRPHYDIRPDYQTSVVHRFLDIESLSTGDKTAAEIWFITPEAYPHTLWVGRELRVAEGSREVGKATVLKVLNPLLLRAGS